MLQIKQIKNLISAEDLSFKVVDSWCFNIEELQSHEESYLDVQTICLAEGHCLCVNSITGGTFSQGSNNMYVICLVEYILCCLLW